MSVAGFFVYIIIQTIIDKFTNFTNKMKKYLLSFILSVAAIAQSYADGYTGVVVTDNEGQNTYYLFEEQPIVKYQDVGGVMNACLCVTGETDPVVSVPLTGGATLSVKYEVFLRVNLNNAGYATFSAKDPSFIATSGVTAYKTAVDDGQIALTALEGNIPAGTGVLLYGETPGTKVNLPVATSGDPADVTGNSLMPTTLSDGSLATKVANSWALGNGDKFLNFTGSAYTHNHAYLVYSAPSSTSALTRGLNIVNGVSGTTSLDNIDNEASTSEGKLLESGRIVIIKNGKKYNLAGQVIE